MRDRYGGSVRSVAAVLTEISPCCEVKVRPMPGLFAAFPALFAQDAPGAGAAPSWWLTLAPFLPLVAIYYFIIIRPQQDQEKKRRQMLDALKKNDKVLTAAGIY